jgi:hypothetical protein
VPIVDLPDDELRALIAALRRAIEGDRYPHAARLDPLRAALARIEAAAEPTPAAKVEKRARSAKAPRG